MVLCEFEIKRIEKLFGNFIESRIPDPSIRKNLILLSESLKKVLKAVNKDE